MPAPIERKLAAIMFTDIAGYTALSAKDSTKASELLKTQENTLKPIVEKHGGSWMKEMGDGLLLTFDSATSAVECSIAIQEAHDVSSKTLAIAKALNDKKWIGHSLFWHGRISESQGDVNEALNYYMQAFELAKNNDDVRQLDYWKMSVGFNINYRLYQLLEDNSYLETAYNQVQEERDKIEPDMKLKFLEFKIPKAIVEEWEKVK